MTTETGPEDAPGDPSTAPAGAPRRQFVPHLASAYSKLAWTGYMLEETREMYHQYFELPPVRFELHPRSETHHLVFTIHEAEDPQAAEIARMGLVNAAAQVVHGARCVLDHLAYAIAKFQSPQATENDLFNVYFQVIEDKKRWDKQAPGRLKLLTDETREQMREMQVFVPGSQGSLTREGLVRLHNLDRTDRHRQLNVALVGTSKINFLKWDPPYVCTEGGAVAWGPGPLDGREVAWIRFEDEVPSDLPEGKHPYDAIPPALVYEDAGPVGWQGVHHIADMINTLMWVVEAADVTVQRFEPLFRGEPVQPLANTMSGLPLPE